MKGELQTIFLEVRQKKFTHRHHDTKMYTIYRKLSFLPKISLLCGKCGFHLKMCTSLAHDRYQNNLLNDNCQFDHKGFVDEY